MSKHRRRRVQRRRTHASAGNRRRIIAGCGLSAGAAFALASSAQAANYEVDRTDDLSVSTCTGAVNDCTLRGAVAAANLAATNDYITFQAGLSGQITLGSELPISDFLYINGPGPAISGNHATRIFNVNMDPGNVGNPASFYDVSLINGSVVGSGGAIYNDDAALQVTDSVLTGNHASSNGGAILDHGGYDDGLSNNIHGSTLSSNSADQGGGAVWADQYFERIELSTISGNSSAFGTGGGVYSVKGARFDDSTLSGNTASGGGGGIGINGVGDTTQLFNSIVANNSATSGAPDVMGDSYVYFSLIENPAGTTVTTGVAAANIFGVDPQLGPLQNNGGTTPVTRFTHRPAATSPVVDKGLSFSGEDQRQSPRPFDVPTIGNSSVMGANASDMGSVELTLAEATVAAEGAPPMTDEPGTKKKKCKKKSKKKKCKKKKKGN